MRNGVIGLVLLWVKQRIRKVNAEGGKVLTKWCIWCFPQFPLILLSGKSWGSRIIHGEVRKFLFALRGQSCWSDSFFSFQCQSAEARRCLICPCLFGVQDPSWSCTQGWRMSHHCCAVSTPCWCLAHGSEVIWQACCLISLKSQRRFQGRHSLLLS